MKDILSMISRNRWPNYIKIPFRYGLYAGIIAFPLMLLLYYTGHHPLLIDMFLDYRIVLLSIAIFLSLKEVRHDNKGYLYFWQGMAGSLALTLVFASLIFVLLNIYMALDSNFLHDYITLSTAQLNALSDEYIESVGKEAYEKSMQLLPKVGSGFISFRFFIQSFVISLFISIIISAILRRHVAKKNSNDRKA